MINYFISPTDLQSPQPGPSGLGEQTPRPGSGHTKRLALSVPGTDKRKRKKSDDSSVLPHWVMQQWTREEEETKSFHASLLTAQREFEAEFFKREEDMFRRRMEAEQATNQQMSTMMGQMIGVMTQLSQGHLGQDPPSQNYRQGHPSQGHMSHGHMSQGHISQGHMSQGHMSVPFTQPLSSFTSFNDPSLPDPSQCGLPQ